MKVSKKNFIWFWKKKHCCTHLYSDFVWAEISVASSRKRFIFIIQNSIFWVKVSKKTFYLISRTKSLHLVQPWFDKVDCLVDELCVLRTTWPLKNHTRTIFISMTSEMQRNNKWGSLLLFKPKYRSGHTENYLFSLSKNIFSGWKYPKNILFEFENRSTDEDVVVDNSKADVEPISEQASDIVVRRLMMALKQCFFFQN